MKRREFLTRTLAAGGALLASSVTFADAPTRGKSRLVLIILRGALDGLAAVPAYGDPGYAALRGDLAVGSRARMAERSCSMGSSGCIRRSRSCSRRTRPG